MVGGDGGNETEAQFPCAEGDQVEGTELISSVEHDLCGSEGDGGAREEDFNDSGGLFSGDPEK